MTNEELFYTVATHLLKQGQKSEDMGGRCLYRSPEGLKCAIGCLIPDEHYVRSLEHISGCNPRVISAAGLDESQAELVTDLQVVHDWGRPIDWPVKLGVVAEKYGLEFCSAPYFARPA